MSGDAMTTGTETDANLLERWREGDSQAGNALVRRHFELVYCFFLSKLDGAAEDLTQRTFLACVEGRDRFRGECSFRAYLLAIARRVLFRHFRDRGIERRYIEQGEVSAVDLGTSPTGVLAAQDEHRLLLRALRHLPLDLQIALELYYWERMTQPDIGHVLGIPEGTVKSRLNRARRLAREKIAELATSRELAESTQGDLAGWARSLRAKLGDVPPEDDRA